jgi:putative transposase
MGEDITYLPFGQSMLYLSTIMDLFNNEIIAYRISASQDVSLVINTLKDAAEVREKNGLILHSDQGAQYTSHSFQRIAKTKRHYHKHVPERQSAWIMPSLNPSTPP